MRKLTRESLLSLEQYAQERKAFRAKVMQHKKNRQIALGDHLTLYFEDALTMQYQVQEMLRVERIFESEGIEQELQAYVPLVPDGCNWKATMMLEYTDAQQRQTALQQLLGIEDKVWIQIDGFNKVFAIADEDLERTNSDKTSAVHFLRFELHPEMIRSVKTGATISIGVDHAAYSNRRDNIPKHVADSLVADLA